MDMILNEFKLLTSTCWNEKYLPLTKDMIKSKNKGRYCLGLRSLFVLDTIFFDTQLLSIYPNVTEQDMNHLAKLAKQQKNKSAEKIEK